MRFHFRLIGGLLVAASFFAASFAVSENVTSPTAAPPMPEAAAPPAGAAVSPPAPQQAESPPAPAAAAPAETAAAPPTQQPAAVPPAEAAVASPDPAAAPAEAAVQPNPADTAPGVGAAVSDAMLQAGYGVFQGYPGQQPPMVLPRKDKLSFYPCAQCHANMPVNTTPRPIMIHATAGLVDGKLDHGQQRFWCLTCHSPTDRNNLQTVAGVKVDFNDAWKVCGQCHSARQRDWYYGAHGKRVGNWKGDVERYNCTECHNPHHPPFRQQKPQPKPPVRSGLGEMPHEGEGEGHPTIWEKHQDRLQPEEGNKK
ncbi:hypothetical protein VSS37_15550 [Candidatus Thiothrix sp. Deng01]|uniref:Cytochrome c7-like domain-containing protein n=1 Tax=Candidatus Thiothrix phosphatis TaxID=3112415 RepID=A0ABU6D0N0_9GAMM|nr:hypothetical protein [Candidatus Thiothrix sp. Deng01]MEB4592401.1 hypothetical protein [Candidatus Thiothrix sp. Deng01]